MPPSLRRFVAVLMTCVVLAALGAACRSLGNLRNQPPTQSDRLMRAYPELRNGRFAVIADFEDPNHMELVKLIGVSPQARYSFNRKHGRRESGAGCLQLTVGSPDDAVIFNNEHAVNWYLKRDWRDYDLLLMAAHAPRRDLTLNLTIVGGSTVEPMAAKSALPLARGWNMIRLDLAEIGEHLPLDEVEELRLSLSGSGKAVKVYLDDIILAGNRTDLFGDSQNREGLPYVQLAGKRWNIGAGSRFELTFANGQIVRWYNLAADPYRLRNLVQGTTLGPSPMVLDSADPNGGGFSALGPTVVARPRILEMNDARTVVASEWRFVEDPDAPLDKRPFQRWVYTIYPTGQLYVDVECTAATQSWDPGGLGLAVTSTVISTDRSQVHNPRGTEDKSDSVAIPAYAIVRSERNDSVLLYVPGGQSGATRMTEQVDELRRRVSLVAVVDQPDTQVARWRCHVLLASAKEFTDEEALARAIDYARPGPLNLELGSPTGSAAGGGNETGFDQRTGCYVIAPDEGRVRLVVDGRRQARFSPAFRILNPQRNKAWVYVDHLLYERFVLDADGNVVFQLPETVRGRTLVEVLFRRPDSPSD